MRVRGCILEGKAVGINAAVLRAGRLFCVVAFLRGKLMENCD